MLMVLNFEIGIYASYFLLMTMTKYLIRNPTREEDFILAQSLRVQVYHYHGGWGRYVSGLAYGVGRSMKLFTQVLFQQVERGLEGWAVTLEAHLPLPPPQASPSEGSTTSQNSTTS